MKIALKKIKLDLLLCLPQVEGSMNTKSSQRFKEST